MPCHLQKFSQLSELKNGVVGPLPLTDPGLTVSEPRRPAFPRRCSRSTPCICPCDGPWTAAIAFGAMVWIAGATHRRVPPTIAPRRSRSRRVMPSSLFRSMRFSGIRAIACCLLPSGERSLGIVTVGVPYRRSHGPSTVSFLRIAARRRSAATPTRGSGASPPTTPATWASVIPTHSGKRERLLGGPLGDRQRSGRRRSDR